MKKSIAILATLTLVALVAAVLAGSSGVTNPITKMTPAGSAHRDRAAEFGDDVVTVMDTLATQNTVLIQTGTFTNAQTTVTFAAAFSVAPKVVAGWTDDITALTSGATNASVAATSITTTNFTMKTDCPVGDGVTNGNYIAVGTR